MNPKIIIALGYVLGGLLDFGVAAVCLYMSYVLLPNQDLPDAAKVVLIGCQIFTAIIFLISGFKEIKKCQTIQ